MFRSIAGKPYASSGLHGKNYTAPLQRFSFLTYLKNSVIVTFVATLVTLLINSMAAYGLAIYEFPGRTAIMLFVIGTLMIPITVILVPVYLVVTELGMINSLWGVILPGGRDTYRCFPASPVHADDTTRSD